MAIEVLQQAAQPLGVQLRLLEARGPNDLDAAFAEMARQQLRAVLVVTDAREEADQRVRPHFCSIDDAMLSQNGRFC
jgi:hypothetical protein